MEVRRLKNGEIVTDELIEALVKEAEAGYDPSQIGPLPARRPPHSESQAFRIECHVDRATFDALLARAEEEQRGVGEIARLALAQYLAAKPDRTMQQAPSADAAASAE